VEQSKNNVCWICLESDDQTSIMCNCKNRHVHPMCLARWQMRCIGKKEELQCRFCDASLKSWMEIVTPPYLQNAMEKAVGIISLHFNDLVVGIEFTKRFNMPSQCKSTLTWVLGLNDTQLQTLRFECHEPFTQTDLVVQGIANIAAVEFCSRATMVLRILKPSSINLDMRNAL
jgi:hypothetical protein